MKSPVEKKLFLIKTNLAIYPVFYVEDVDILEATEKAKTIAEFYGHEKVVGMVSSVDTPLLDLKEE